MSYDKDAGTITLDERVFEVEADHDGSHPVARIYTVEDVPEVEGRILYEEDGSFCDPRDACNVGTMLCDYRGYNLGDDKPPGDSERTRGCERCDGKGYIPNVSITREEAQWLDEHNIVVDADGDVTCPPCEGLGEIEVPLLEWIKAEYDATVILPLYVYEHSGITIKAGAANVWDPRGQFMGDEAGWDTSLVGMVFDTKQGREDTGVPADQIEEALRGEVAEYARWLEGDVYWVKATAPGWDESCGGYIGFEYAEDQAYEFLEDALKHALAERIERAHWAARDTVTI